jgi:hypothetical protein
MLRTAVLCPAAFEAAAEFRPVVPLNRPGDPPAMNSRRRTVKPSSSHLIAEPIAVRCPWEPDRSLPEFGAVPEPQDIVPGRQRQQM